MGVEVDVLSFSSDYKLHCPLWSENGVTDAVRCGCARVNVHVHMRAHMHLLQCALSRETTAP